MKRTIVRSKQITYPQGEKFAFTIFDDTDKATVETLAPVYELLDKLGLRTTKSVWVLPSEEPQIEANQGQTLSDPAYLSFIRDLARNGFEIAWHGARGGHTPRPLTVQALNLFCRELGFDPRTHANHLNNRESLYWGTKRLNSTLPRVAYQLATRRRGETYEGDVADSPYFWGDLAKERIHYVRNFVFRGINTLAMNPSLPYCDPCKPLVRYWFSSADGHDVQTFNYLLSGANQDTLERESGVCIVYTHFANGFVDHGRVDSATVALLSELARRPGWFVPVAELLDFLISQRPDSTIPPAELQRLEWTWLWEKVRRGSS